MQSWSSMISSWGLSQLNTVQEVKSPARKRSNWSQVTTSARLTGARVISMVKSCWRQFTFQPSKASVSARLDNSTIPIASLSPFPSAASTVASSSYRESVSETSVRSGSRSSVFTGSIGLRKSSTRAAWVHRQSPRPDIRQVSSWTDWTRAPVFNSLSVQSIRTGRRWMWSARNYWNSWRVKMTN